MDAHPLSHTDWVISPFLSLVLLPLRFSKSWRVWKIIFARHTGGTWGQLKFHIERGDMCPMSLDYMTITNTKYKDLISNAEVLFTILIRNSFLLFWTKLFHIRLYVWKWEFFVEFFKFLIAGLLKKLQVGGSRGAKNSYCFISHRDSEFYKSIFLNNVLGVWSLFKTDCSSVSIIGQCSGPVACGSEIDFYPNNTLLYSVLRTVVLRLSQCAPVPSTRCVRTILWGS